MDNIPEEGKPRRRANGKGSIGFEKRRNKWRARFTVHTADGPKRRSLYGDSQQEAEMKLYRALGWWDRLSEMSVDDDAFQHVYFVQGIHGGPIKIGTTSDIETRFATMQANSPVILRILFLLPNAGHEVEAKLHKQFSLLRLHGEWFDNSKELLSYIDTLKRQHRDMKIQNEAQAASRKVLHDLRAGRNVSSGEQS